MKFLSVFSILVFTLCLVSCAGNKAVEHAPVKFGAPVQVAPDYYYRSEPTYPNPRYNDYDQNYVNPLDEYRRDDYYSPYYYQQSHKSASY